MKLWAKADDDIRLSGEARAFEIVAIECQYGRKYRMARETTTDNKPSQQFNFTE